MVDGSETRKLKMLLLSYHSPTNIISAGGFKRTFEILKRTPEEVEIFVVDNSPSFISELEGRSIHVLEYRVPALIKKLEKRQFIVERLAEWFLSLIFMIAACLRMKLERRTFDLIYVPSSEIFPSLVAGVVARFIFDTKLVVCNMNIDIYSDPVKRLLVRLHNRADGVIALSEDLRDKLRHMGTSTTIEVNGAGLDQEYISSILESRSVEKCFEGVFVGRTTLHKGSLDLVEIWSLVTRALPEARLLMIGSLDPVNLSLLQASIRKRNLAGNIAIAGTVDEETKFLLMRASKVCLFPSHVEEWGIVPQEALASGLPVVLYDLPVYRENIRACEAVFPIEVGDCAAMAEKTLELLSDNRFLEYEAAGRKFVAGYNWDTIAEAEFRIMTGCK